MPQVTSPNHIKPQCVLILCDAFSASFSILTIKKITEILPSLLNKPFYKIVGDATCINSALFKPF